MVGKFQFDLISPERMIFSEQVESVTIPGSEGFFSVLAGHMPLVARVLPGMLRINRGEKESIDLVIFGGFAEVAPERTSVLVDSAVPMEKLNEHDIEQRISHARALLEDVRTEESRSRLEEFIYHMSAIRNIHI